MRIYTKAFTLVLALLLPTLVASAQNVTVRGQVIDETDSPIIAAGVVQKGTQKGAITDIDGRFSISVDKGSVLEISTIGYLREEILADSDKDVMIKLVPDTQMLEETIVIGYGVQKKSDVTGAISQVKSEDLQNRTSVSPESALQGKTSGVQIVSASARPGATPSVRIRGISSNGTYSGSTGFDPNGPLYVVDGRIASGLSGIDPNDIESMEILKDGASAAIYGARAGNGVILVTTRKGQGEGKITYSYQLTSQSLGRTPHMMNSEQYVDYYLEAGFFDLETFYRNWDQKTNTDWLDYSYENSFMHRHNLTFAAGGDQGSLYVSGTYLKDNGMFAGDNDTYNRATVMVNGSWKFKPWLELQTNNQIEFFESESVSENNEHGSAILATLTLDPLTPTVYQDGVFPSFVQEYIAQGKTLLRDDEGRIYGLSYFNQSENVNPRIMRDRSHSETKGFNISGSMALNFKPFKDLVLTSRLGYKLSAYDNYGYSNDYYANSTALQDYVGISGGVGDSFYYQWENFANYIKQLGKHSLSLMAGTSYSQLRSVTASGESAANGDLGVIKDNPLFYYFKYTTATTTKTIKGVEPSYNRNLSYFGRASWNYLGRYNLQVSFRADAADLSVLPLKKRWGYFPAVSAGWTVSDEPFFNNIKGTIPFLKFRASWGQNGNTASLGSYMYASVIGAGEYYPTTTNSSSQYITGFAPTYSGNDDLKWETSEQFNIGIDSRFFSDRLSFSADWFNKTTKDLIVIGTKPSMLIGVNASPVNAGNVVNRGFEFELKWKDHVGDFAYGISANLSTLHNEVTYIHESLSSGLDGASFRNYGVITRFEKGYPAWHFYGYKFAGIDPSNGNALFHVLDSDGNETGTTTASPTDSDKTDLGSGIHTLNAGLTLNLAWKGFDAVVFATGAFGGKVFNCLNEVEFARNRLTYFTADRWTPTNTDGTMPAANAANWTQFLTSSGVVLDGTFVKIKQIQIGYTVPSRITKRFKVDNLRVYGSLDDFFTFTSYPGFDPEITGSGNALGVDKGTYPTSRKVVFGVNITF